MRIAAIVVSSYTRDAIIGDAIETVPWADKIILVHITNGETVPDHTPEIAFAVCHYRLEILEVGLVATMAEARNKGLEYAAARGYDWAVQLDTDERINWHGINVPATPADIPENIGVLTMYSDDYRYHKGRFFRLPPSGRFYGHSHEDWRPMIGIATMPQAITFSEIVKPEPLIVRNLLEQLEAIKRDITEEPNVQRWRDYYDDCVARLKAFEERG